MTCTKKSFETFELAQHALRTIKHDTSDSRRPVRSYRCTDCGNYHLTSNHEKGHAHKKKGKQRNKIKMDPNEALEDYKVHKKKKKEKSFHIIKRFS